MALLSVDDLVVHFPVGKRGFRPGGSVVRAVDGVSFDIAEGECLGLVGESGSGKSTLGRTLLHLIKPTKGAVTFDRRNLGTLGRRAMRDLRRDMQIIFQDPASSLDPLMRVGELISEPLLVHRLGTAADRHARVRELLSQVGLDESYADRFSSELSGGQRQRVAIARALALDPKFIVCDEPTSALDVSVQSQVVSLLAALQDRLNLTYLFISHDLAMIRQISTRIAVMYLGQIVEMGPASRVYDAPAHPYTQALLSAMPVPRPRDQRKREKIILRGDPPSPIDPPPGCRFHTRCPHVMDVCRTVDPITTAVTAGGTVSCHLHTEDPTLRSGPGDS